MGLLDDAIREHLDLKRRRGADPAEVERDERDALGPVRRGPEGSAEADLEHPAVAGEGLGHDHEEFDYEHGGAYDLEQPHEYNGAAETEAAAPAPAPPPEFEPAVDQPTQAWHPDDEELFEPGLEPGLEEDDLVEEAPIAQAPPEPAVPPAPPPPFLEEPVSHEPPPVEEPPAAHEPPVHEPPVHEPPAAPLPVRAEPVQPLDGETAEYDMALEDELEEEPAGEDMLEETPEFLQDTPDHDRLWFEQRPPKDFDFDD
jgi:hypothetical protein